MNKVLTTFAEKGLFETLDDAKIAEMAEVSVEEVAQARAELAEAKGEDPAEAGEPEAPSEAEKKAAKKKAAAEKRKATMARKKAEAEAKAAKEAAAAEAKAAEEAAKKKAAAANRGPVIVVKPMIARRANGRSWPLRRRDVYTRDDAVYLREHYPQAIKDYVPKAKS